MARDARWVDLSSRAAFLIAPLGKLYHAERARLALEAELAWDESDPETSVQIARITAQAAASTVLLDWRGVTFRGQYNPPYTPEKGADVLFGSPHLLNSVLRAAEGTIKRNESLARRAATALRWQLQWGKGVDALRLSYRKTGTVPKALAEQPELTPDIRFYLDAFYQLSRFRGSNGFGVNPLVYSEISAYAVSCGFEQHSWSHEVFLDVLAELDSAYTEFMRQKQEASDSASRGKKSKTKVQVPSGYRTRKS